jgi:hypothetical protein
MKVIPAYLMKVILSVPDEGYSDRTWYTGITFIRYTGITFIRYAGITFIRYTQNRMVGKPNICSCSVLANIHFIPALLLYCA